MGQRERLRSGWRGEGEARARRALQVWLTRNPARPPSLGRALRLPQAQAPPCSSFPPHAARKAFCLRPLCYRLAAAAWEWRKRHHHRMVSWGTEHTEERCVGSRVSRGRGRRGMLSAPTPTPHRSGQDHGAEGGVELHSSNHDAGPGQSQESSGLQTVPQTCPKCRSRNWAFVPTH